MWPFISRKEGAFFGLIADPETNTKILTSIINETAVETTTNVGSKMSNVGTQLQNFTIENVEGVNMEDVTMAQKLSIDASSLTNASTNKELQNQMIAKITDAIESRRSQFPELTGGKTSTDIQQMVKNQVSNKMSTSVMAKMKNEISQEQNFRIANSRGVNIKKFSMVQEAKGIYKQINSLAEGIVSDLKQSSETAAGVKNIASNPITDIVDSAGGIIKTVADAFGVDTSTMIVIGVVLIVGIIAGVYTLNSGEDDKFQMMQQMMMQRPIQAPIQPPPPPPPPSMGSYQIPSIYMAPPPPAQY
jgi:hypothetical protein